MTGSAKQSRFKKRLDCFVAFAPRNDAATADATAPSRGTNAPESSDKPSGRRGRRECRVFFAPAASRAKVESTRVSHHRHAEHSGIPCAMVYGLLRDLPGDRALLPPSPPGCARHHRPVDVSVETSGPHDFAVRCHVVRLVDITASIASRSPTHRDDREAPLSSGTGRREGIEMICPTGRAKYFCGEGWTVESALIELEEFDF